MKTFIFLLLTSFIISNSFISQSTPESPELKEATDLTNAAVKLFKEQKFDEALANVKRALEIRERLLPPTDPRVSYSLSHSGDLYLATRDYDKARKTFERLLVIQEQRFGPADINLAFTLDRLAVLYNRDRKPAKAEEIYQRALALREKAFGPEHVQVADTLYALGEFYRTRREYDRSLASYKKALTIYGRLTGVNTAEFERTSTGFSCMAYESQNTKLLKELEEIQKQFVTGAVPEPAELLNGKATTMAKPDWPREARDLGVQGLVVVQVEIDEQGNVISAKDICKGPPYLSESAVRAALKSRFSPTTLSGVPVKAKGVLRYNFVNNGTIWR